MMMSGSLKCLIAVIVISNVGSSISNKFTCNALDAYFPMSAVKLNLPFNEKSQSIFSVIPIGQFQVISTANDRNSSDYVYSLENNNLLRINSTTGQVYIRHDYGPVEGRLKLVLTALAKNAPLTSKISHMTLELTPMSEEDYCENLENICFWTSAHYTILEDSIIDKEGSPGIESMEDNESPLLVGSLSPRAAKYLCSNSNVKYRLESSEKYFSLKNNILYKNLRMDHDALNATESSNLTASVVCVVKLDGNMTKEYRKLLNISLIDRNDNGPELQDNKVYHFNLEDPHFKANDYIGEKILFTDKDSVETNAHMSYTIYNDTHDLVRPDCNTYEADHTGQRHTIISCQIIFARNGLLSQSVYCFFLEASDNTIVDERVNKTAKAHICIHTNPNKIHQADRPHALPLRGQQRLKSAVINSAETMLIGEGSPYTRAALTQAVFAGYPKDVYVYRKAMAFSRVAQPEDVENLMSKTMLRFDLVEDRSGAFSITPLAGIVYVRNVAALEQSPETVYFLNVTWQDSHPRSFVINVHLRDGRPENASCEHKVKSRSQTCSQVKYRSQCIKFCGLATNGGPCSWRGSNGATFSRNYASCVPDTRFCPDNICDPLEQLNPLICPQDCIAGNRVMGPHSVNGNKHGILSASGTCTCDDNGKCSCAPLDDEEPRPKRKKKNETLVTANKPPESFTSPSAAAGNLSLNTSATGQRDPLQTANFACGKSCLAVSITCPLVFSVLIVCFVISRRTLNRRTIGKEALSSQKDLEHNLGGGDGGGVGECDPGSGDLPLMEMDRTTFKFEEMSETKWEFDREKLKLDIVLGEGEFGKVVKGYATDIAGIRGVTTVAVKMLKNGANSVEFMALLSEFQLLQEVSHPNVIRLLGACTKGDSPLIIIEYARYGSLRSYLRLSRKIECSGVDFTDGVEPVTVKQILSFAWQICKGMAYLMEIKLVHRDLAARNVLLADGKVCKVSDFGLTRDVYEDDAYLKRSRDRVPVKWMAPESLADHVYTTKSDVWAFGVLCWELITEGQSPYPGIPPQNLYHLLKSGYRMERPENCSEEVYSIVRSCWADDPNARPSFKYLASQFEKLLGNNIKYLELESNAVSNPTYCSDETSSELPFATTPSSDPDCLDHLWRPPKICYDLNDCPPDSREFSKTFNVEFQPPPGYDIPRPLIESGNIEQRLRYENDLRFPLNIRKSVCAGSCLSGSQNGSGGGGVVVGNGSVVVPHYAVPVKRGRSYMDMTNRTHIPDNLDIIDFEKHISKKISFRFSSLLDLKEQDSCV